MAQVLVLEKSKEITLLSLLLAKNESINVVNKSTIEELVSLFDLLGNIDLVICDATFMVELQKNFQNLHFFAYEEKSDNEVNIKQINAILGLDTSSLKPQVRELSGYRALSINYFTSIKSLSINSDLYIKLKKGTAESFIKRLNANDIFTDVEIDKYIKMGLTEFYVLRENYETVSNGIISLLTSELSNTTNSFNSQKTMEQDTFLISMDRMKSLGIDALTLQLVDETVISIKKSVSEKTALGKFLKFLTENKSTYAYASSYLTCLTMTTVLNSLGGDSEITSEQITLASLFHNFSLEDEAELKIFSKADLSQSSITNDRKNEVKMHALTASGIVAQQSKIPPIVLTVIKEHHGSPLGVDFPDEPSKNLHQMSKCFMVCEYFSHLILEKGPTLKKADAMEIIGKLKVKFGARYYIEFVNAIEKITS
jgi:hypothetical protein